MKQVIIYSTPTCIYCRMVKDWLKEKGVEYTEFDLSVDAVKRDEIIKRTGQMGVPVIEIGEEFVIGFDRKRIEQLLSL